MIQFKPLTWCTHKDIEGKYANLNGFGWRYSVVKQKNGKVELALLDTNYEYTPGFPEYYASVDEAEEKANHHYMSLLKNFVQTY